ncbi:MAG: TetR/AcrR family transcriptional regulator [Spongiibacteraceae bacterium]
MKTKDEILSSRPGRPCFDSNRKVWDAILEATLRIIDGHPYKRISTRRIASAAGVTTAMVNYYFQNKEGLIVELVHEAFTQFEQMVKALREDSNIIPGQHTRRLMETLLAGSRKLASIIRLINHETMIEDSVIRRAYLGKLSAGTTLPIQDLLQNWAERGIYRGDLDVRYLSLVISGALLRPASMGDRIQQSHGIAPHELETTEWLDFLVDGFERWLQPPIITATMQASTL